MKKLTPLALLTFPLMAALAMISACGKFEEDVATFATNPNTVATVDALMAQAGDALQQAIDQAETFALHVLATDPNGAIVKRDVAAELRAIKTDLERVNLPVKVD